MINSSLFIPKLTQTLDVDALKNGMNSWKKKYKASVYPPQSSAPISIICLANTIRNMGPYRASITLPVETTINHYSKLLASREHVGDLVERHAMRGFLRSSYIVQDLTDVITADSFLHLGDSSLPLDFNCQ